MAFEIYGDLNLHLGQLKNVKLEQVSSLPTASASEYDRVVFNTTDSTPYICVGNATDGYKWQALKVTSTSYSGSGNVVSSISYDAETGVLSYFKGINAVEQVSGKGLSTNDYTTADMNKLAGIETGAEVNQNAFSNVKNGSTTIAAGSKTDTIEFEAGSNVTITADATNKKLTIAATDTDTKVTSADNHYTPSGTTAPTLNTATTPTDNTVDVISQVKGDAKGHVVSQDRVKVPTKAYVDGLIADLGTALQFKGTIGKGGTITTLPNSHKVGDTYLVKTAGSYARQTCDVGDMIICVATGTTASNDDWQVIQGNWTAVDGTDTLAWGNTVTLATIGGVTIDATLPANPNTDTKVTSVANHYEPTEDASSQIDAASGKYVSGIKRDAAGHVTGITEGTLPTDTDTGATSVEVTGDGNAVTGASYSAATRKMTLTKGTTFLTEHQDISGKADKTATVSDVAYDTTNKKITKTINGTTSDVVTAAKIVTDGGGIKEHQSLDGYVNEIEITGSGNAVTSVSKTNKKITYTKGSTFLTASDVADKLQGFRTNALTGSTGSVGNAIHGFTEIYSVQAYVGASQVFLNELNITTETVGGETKRSMIEWNAGSTSFTSSSEFRLLIIGK